MGRCGGLHLGRLDERVQCGGHLPVGSARAFSLFCSSVSSRIRAYYAVGVVAMGKHYRHRPVAQPPTPPQRLHEDGKPYPPAGRPTQRTSPAPLPNDPTPRSTRSRQRSSSEPANIPSKSDSGTTSLQDATSASKPSILNNTTTTPRRQLTSNPVNIHPAPQHAVNHRSGPPPTPWCTPMTATPGVRSCWIVEGTKVLGGISLRVDRHPSAHLGHIGYGVRPSARGQGVASWALGEVLPHARSEGLDHVLLVCLSNNVGSVRTIEGQHGVRIHSNPTGAANC